MDMMTAVALNRRAIAEGARPRVFDWNKAAEMIRDKEAKYAEAGLGGDWGNTGGVIFNDGHIVTDEYTYLKSNWAEPQIMLDGNNPIPCWVYADTVSWDAHTKWPDSAKDILPEEMRKEGGEWTEDDERCQGL